jgi:hypothetical protein
VDLGGNPQALQKNVWVGFALPIFLTQYSAIYNLDVATQLVSIEQERLVHLLKRPTTAITLHALNGEFAIATAPHSLRAWYVASPTKVGFAWGLCKCSNKHWRLTDRLTEAPMVPTKGFSPKSSPEQTAHAIADATSTVGIEDW